MKYRYIEICLKSTCLLIFACYLADQSSNF